MKTQVSNKNGLKKFEVLSNDEMAKIAGGKNDKDKKVKGTITITSISLSPKEKDIFDPDEK
ncbi:MAG: bacteriocin [Prolixibacteraceae bacterium]|nr:bacteriocin [Prolixibacteraceae bacterium]